jgi:hypothetical protein
VPTTNGAILQDDLLSDSKAEAGMMTQACRSNHSGSDLHDRRQVSRCYAYVCRGVLRCEMGALLRLLRRGGMCYARRPTAQGLICDGGGRGSPG